jgi:hypothetical protein
MTQLDPTDRRPSQQPLPPDLTDLDAEIARDATARDRIRADLAAAKAAYAALPRWRRRLVDRALQRWHETL